MFYVYILQSIRNKNYYVGFSGNLKKRLKDHYGHTVKTTKSGSPYKLVWHSGFGEKKKAMDFERYLKSGSGFAFRNKRLV